MREAMRMLIIVLPAVTAGFLVGLFTGVTWLGGMVAIVAALLTDEITRPAKPWRKNCGPMEILRAMWWMALFSSPVVLFGYSVYPPMPTWIGGALLVALWLGFETALPPHRVTVYHPSSPGMRVIVHRGFWARMFKPKEHATLNETVRFYRKGGV